MPNSIRLIVAFAFLGSAIALMFFGYWGWGILLIFLALLVAVTFFFNEKMLIAQFYLRKEDMNKAEVWLNKIKDYEKELIQAQHGYYHLLIGLTESRRAPLQSEKYFKRALSLGMTMDHNVALAKLSLAGIAMSKRNKREATMYLQEAKKADKNKLLAEQIKMMKDQMVQLDKTVIQSRGGGGGYRGR